MQADALISNAHDADLRRRGPNLTTNAARDELEREILAVLAATDSARARVPTNETRAEGRRVEAMVWRTAVARVLGIVSDDFARRVIEIASMFEGRSELKTPLAICADNVPEDNDGVLADKVFRGYLSIDSEMLGDPLVDVFCVSIQKLSFLKEIHTLHGSRPEAVLQDGVTREEVEIANQRDQCNRLISADPEAMLCLIELARAAEDLVKSAPDCVSAIIRMRFAGLIRAVKTMNAYVVTREFKIEVGSWLDDLSDDASADVSA